MNQSPDLHAASIVGSCCGNEAWRGRLCPYHEGYQDGYEAALAAEAALLDAAQSDGEDPS